ncbi:uncharacterized protein LOC132028174 [Mustela nigripes]|uniref:uncharacterized protein LOC132028174 n=1 Tax=Mustela nigripes TaxID=77151 RepID=UPI002814C844|nr:uncharacterized protein LOC132028174 [Mustela nigripes]
MCPGENMALGLPQAGHRADWSTRPPHPAEGALRTGPGTGDLQGRGSSGCQSPCLGAGAGLGEAPARKESPRLHYKARVLHVPGADPQRPGRPPCKCPPGGFTGDRRRRRTEAPPPAPETASRKTLPGGPTCHSFGPPKLSRRLTFPSPCPGVTCGSYLLAHWSRPGAVRIQGVLPFPMHRGPCSSRKGQDTLPLEPAVSAGVGCSFHPRARPPLKPEQDVHHNPSCPHGTPRWLTRTPQTSGAVFSASCPGRAVSGTRLPQPRHMSPFFPHCC